MAHGNVCSKEWIVRQYDHEVQAGSAIKPLVGPSGRGPGNASVVVPVLGSKRGIVIGCGIDPRLGDLDPYEMARCAVDEAIRNVVAVGADPERIAILDNFSWGDCKNPETLGAMVRAARGCHDAALLFGAPFISGKDSLNNEFRTEHGSIRIPHTLLISAMGQVDDVTRCVTSDAKRAGSPLWLLGETRREGVPTVADDAPANMRAMAAAIRNGKVRAVHDLAEGGLAVAAAEMAIGGEMGVAIETDIDLFAETPSRFLIEADENPGGGAVRVGTLLAEPRLVYPGFELTLDEAEAAFFIWETML